MTSVLRQLQAEWNNLVPAAQARGVPRVRPLNLPLETIAYRREKLEWLKAQLGSSASLDSFTFGVELEFIMPDGMTMDRVARLITDGGVPCRYEGYNHSNRGSWKVVSDGSLNSHRGAEVVSPVLQGENGFAQLRKVCDALTAARVRISRRCGLHVHVGATNEGVGFFRNLVKTYAGAEQLLDTVMAPSRRGSNNQYAQPVRFNSFTANAIDQANNLNQVASAIGQHSGSGNARSNGRYCKINLQSFWQHGTVEFRHHQGTVEKMKVENWTRLCLRMCVAAKNGTQVYLASDNLDQFLTKVGTPDLEKSYFTGRVDFFRRVLNRSGAANETVSR